MGVSLFTYWIERASSAGHILTKGDKITEKELSEISILEGERDNGVNLNGRKVKWTETKINRLADLIKKRDKKPELPKGVKTHLDNVFRSQFDRRNRILQNKYLTKGEYCEQDSLQLLSDLDSEFYEKNEKYYENDFVCGTPDNVQLDVKDIKTNFDKDSFDKAELTSLYTWQIRVYLWLCGFTKGELVYCLVNNPYKQLDKAIYYLKENLNDLDGSSDEFLKQAQQIERNMIFDTDAWDKNHPHYQWFNTKKDFTISKIRKIKRFDVELLPEHIEFIKQRVIMCREYLMEKEKIELAILKEYSEEDYNKKIEFIKNNSK